MNRRYCRRTKQVHPHSCATFQRGCISISAGALADAACITPTKQSRISHRGGGGDNLKKPSSDLRGRALVKRTTRRTNKQTNKQTRESVNGALAPLWLTNRTRHFSGSGDMKSDRGGRATCLSKPQRPARRRLPRQTRSSPDTFPLQPAKALRFPCRTQPLVKTISSSSRTSNANGRRTLTLFSLSLSLFSLFCLSKKCENPTLALMHGRS